MVPTTTSLMKGQIKRKLNQINEIDFFFALLMLSDIRMKLCVKK
jgi:hypothetical protein